MSIVSSGDKKKFIAWLLKTHKLARRDCVWLLNYMLSKDEVLENVHFTEDVVHCSWGAVIKAVDYEGAAFRCYKGSLMSNDVEQLFKELRSNENDQLYLQIDFPGKESSARYLAILEDNPFHPINDMDKVDIEIKEIIDKLELENIRKEIDNALDRNDQELFFALCKICDKKEKEIEEVNSQIL